MSGYNQERGYDYKGGISLGFHGAAGVDIMFTDRFGLFAEVAGNFQNYAPKKGIMTKYTVNGVNQLSSIPASQRDIECVDSYTETSGSSGSTQSIKNTKIYLPFSSIGANIGLHIAFGKKAEK